MSTLTITPTQARRLAITRQHLSGPRPAPTPTAIMELFRDLGCVQIDPVSAVERTQFLVLWSRLGNYEKAHLNTLLFQERQLFEYWAHAASIVLTEDYPIHRAMMRHAATGKNHDSAGAQQSRTWYLENEPFRRYILDQLRKKGPLPIGKLEDRSITPWGSLGWANSPNGRQHVSKMINMLWTRGEVMVTERSGLQKKWGLAENHLPDWTPRHELTDEAVVYQAAQRSLRALGVGTAKQIKNHFIRDRYPGLEETLTTLLAEGRIAPVKISRDDITWPGNWYIHTDDLPLSAHLDGDGWQPRTTLLSPFDNLICDRERTELMWDFYFRIEIYVPKAKRQYGYYVLPILHGDRLIGRIDPKMDRKSGTLHINAVYTEPGVLRDDATTQAITTAINQLGKFLQANKIVYANGELFN